MDFGLRQPQRLGNSLKNPRICLMEEEVAHLLQDEFVGFKTFTHNVTAPTHSLREDGAAHHPGTDTIGAPFLPWQRWKGRAPKGLSVQFVQQRAIGVEVV